MVKYARVRVCLNIHTCKIIIHLRKHLSERVDNTYFPFCLVSQKEVSTVIDEVEEIIIINELFYFPDRDCVTRLVFRDGSANIVRKKQFFIITILIENNHVYCYVPETMCNEPMPVPGAKVSYSSLSVHASATYRCSEGYRAAGGDFSHTCQVDGTWSGQRPTCEGQ